MYRVSVALIAQSAIPGMARLATYVVFAIVESSDETVRPRALVVAQ